MEGLLLSSALVTLILVLYSLYRLNERLMRLEANKHKALKIRGDQPPVPEPAPAVQPLPDDVFLGLRGEALFHAMAGEDGQSHSFAEDAKKRFELIVRKHILATLESVQGQSDEPVSNPRTIRTLRGAFESWLPEAFMGVLTTEGAVLSQDPSNQDAKATLNSAIRDLYQRLQLDPPGDFLNTEEGDSGQSAEPADASESSEASESESSEDAAERQAQSLRARAGGFAE